MFAICLEFVQSSCFLREEQLRCRLWSPLLETAICNNSRHLFHGHEYKINSHVKGYKKDHRCDIVEILRLDIHEDFHAPPLMVELSAVGKVTQDTYHKDYEKLASQMQASLFYYITKLGRNVDQCKKLKIYGLLINQLQYQLFVMTPIIECDEEQGKMKHATFVVTSPRKWRRSLNLKFETFKSIDEKISFGTETDEQGYQKNIIDAYEKEQFEEESVESAEEESNESVEEESNESAEEESNESAEEESIKPESNAAVKKDTMCYQEFSRIPLKNVSYTTLLPHLLFFQALGKEIRAYAEELVVMMKNNQLTHKPSYPKNAKTPFSGRKSSSAPSKSPSITPSLRRSKTKSGLVDSKRPGYTVTLRKCARLEEVQMLSSLQDCRQVVSLLDVSFSNNNNNNARDGEMMYLVMEKLISWYDYMHGIHVLPNNLGIYIGAGLLFMKDMALALQFLQDRGVVHRDLSHNNVMYSRLSHGWKLIDFEFARQLDGQQQQKSLKNDGVYGTKPYIAPEIINGEDYDCRADWYSLGVLFVERFYCHYPGSVPGDVSLDTRSIATRLSYRNPSKRPQPWIFIAKYNRQLYQLHRYLLLEEDKHLRFDLLNFLPGLGPALADNLAKGKRKKSIEKQDKENVAPLQ